jgi:uncharacterized HAD superfamily protein
MKKYGIDLDGVVFDFVSAFMAFINKKENKSLAYSDITDYYWHNCIDWLDKDMWNKHFNVFGHSGGYARLPFYDGAKEGLTTLVDDPDTEVHIITQRPDYSELDTLWAVGLNFNISKHNITLSKACSLGGSKAWDVIGLGVDVFLDDANHNVFDVAENTDAKVYLMDQPYNQGWTHPKITRVKDWNEFLKLEGINV